jgi:S1-C subfamily serine protease
MRHRPLIIIVLAASLGSATYFLFIFQRPVLSSSKETLSTIATTDPSPEALVKTDLLPTLWRLRRGNPWSERTITVKNGDSISSILLLEFGAALDEIKAITAVLGRLGKENGVKEGEKLRVLLAPVPSAKRLQPIRVIVADDAGLQGVAALSDAGKYVAVDVRSMDELKWTLEEEKVTLGEDLPQETSRQQASNPKAQAKATTADSPKPPQKTAKSSGTGFFVSQDGHLITNHHVVEGCQTLTASIADVVTSLRIVATSDSDDLAVLRAEVNPQSIASFREAAKIIQGETVVTYGFPLSGLLASSGNVSTGLVTALAGLRDDPHQLQISAPVQPGNSGGPLADSKGAVIGVIASKLNALRIARLTDDIPQNINFAIKVSSVIDHGCSWSDLSNRDVFQGIERG